MITAILFLIFPSLLMISFEVVESASPQIVCLGAVRYACGKYGERSALVAGLVDIAPPSEGRRDDRGVILSGMSRAFGFARSAGTRSRRTSLRFEARRHFQSKRGPSTASRAAQKPRGGKKRGTSLRMTVQGGGAGSNRITERSAVVAELVVGGRLHAIKPLEVPVSDENAVRAIGARLLEAWNAHDMKAFAALFRDDAEFVNVYGMWSTRRGVPTPSMRRHMRRFFVAAS